MAQLGSRVKPRADRRRGSCRVRALRSSAGDGALQGRRRLLPEPRPGGRRDQRRRAPAGHQGAGVGQPDRPHRGARPRPARGGRAARAGVPQARAGQPEPAHQAAVGSPHLVELASPTTTPGPHLSLPTPRPPPTLTADTVALDALQETPGRATGGAGRQGAPADGARHVRRSGRRNARIQGCRRSGTPRGPGPAPRPGSTPRCRR
jgi:hypothetical protein